MVVSFKSGFYEFVERSKYPSMRAKASENPGIVNSVSSIYTDDNIDGFGDLNIYELDKLNLSKYFIFSCLFDYDDDSRRIPTDIPIIKSALLDSLGSCGLSNVILPGYTLRDGLAVDGWRYLFFRRRPPMSLARDVMGLKEYIGRVHKDDWLVDGRSFGYLINSKALDALQRVNIKFPGKPRFVMPLQ
jgi:hypothetical protein